MRFNLFGQKVLAGDLELFLLGIAGQMCIRDSLCGILVRETELADVEKQVQARIKKQIEKNQKDYYLREQIKAIQTELGDKDGTDVEDLRERLEKTPLNDEAREKAEKELERLSRMAPGTPEIGVSRTYVEWRCV